MPSDEAECETGNMEATLGGRTLKAPVITGTSGVDCGKPGEGTGCPGVRVLLPALEPTEAERGMSPGGCGCGCGGITRGIWWFDSTTPLDGMRCISVPEWLPCTLDAFSTSMRGHGLADLPLSEAVLGTRGTGLTREGGAYCRIGRVAFGGVPVTHGTPGERVPGIGLGDGRCLNSFSDTCSLISKSYSPDIGWWATTFAGTRPEGVS
mmetsp:Transcript_43674/g.103083  ORF Transcript_43674/g.103083 Transcript_43674/m.103083 type:complete len:208 (-) Transcript_43674:896-1519(-)